MEQAVDEVAFWAKVDRSGDCWHWTGASLAHGYGACKCRRNGKRNQTLGAHRASWIIHNGQIPAGMSVLHRCDNPKCVNPSHLFLGTQADNMHDKMEKGRHVKANTYGPGDHKRGEAHPACKLSDAIVERVFALRESGMSHRKIAEAVGCSGAYVSMLLSGKARTQSTKKRAKSLQTEVEG